MLIRALVAAVALVAAYPADAQQVTHIDRAPSDLKPLPVSIHGRVQTNPDGGWIRQWPGTYFETAFTGSAIYFRVGDGDVGLRVRLDDGPPAALVKPAPGFYRVTALGAGTHRLRVDVASESREGATRVGGVFVDGEGAAAPIVRRSRAIEFIGDSHTVGYANTSDTRQCTDAEVWARTDASRGVPALTAAHYDADYEVNAISGRGVVRNYGGFAGDTLPEAYPFALFDHATPARDGDWRPRVIVISLGTNDFSTPLHAGERWKTRGELHADYEAAYVRFVKGLRVRAPGAYVLLWATDMADGEVAAETAKVAERLRRGGDRRVGYVEVAGLAFSACNSHPSIADDGRIAAAIIKRLDAQGDVWGR